ncbi:MAG TPA: IclR family transcriptional regulator [Candidatus Acidoferrales bacterium]|nr:IclR family transcriptional regulator [Candidatus Acidoferrales bacterium]
MKRASSRSLISKAKNSDLRSVQRNSQPLAITSVKRAFAIVELLAFSDHPKALSHIAAEIGMAPSTVHRFLRTLITLGFVSQDQRTEGYQATLKLFNLGAIIVSRFNLVERALPAMRKIAEQLGESVSLTFREGLEGILLERVEGREGVQVFTKYRRVPLYCTAAGKAILAGFDSKSLGNYLGCVSLKARTEFTFTNVSDLQAELSKVRRLGFAVDNQELEIGAKCVAVPIALSDTMFAAISVSALAPRMTNSRILQIAHILKAAVADLNAAIAYHDRDAD